MRSHFIVLFVLFGISSMAHAQVSVPFVGCPAVGQMGPVGAPVGRPKIVALSERTASELAWYQTAEDGGGLGVLAPRGWHCFGTYGSNGESLYVAPDPLDIDKILLRKGWSGFLGPAIQLSRSLGGTSGRFEVAQIIARVFPAYRWFVRKVIAEVLEPASDFPFGPFLSDRLRYPSQRVVRFTTPANAKGLGTKSWLLPSATPIEGVCVLFPNDEMNLQMLAVRLESGQEALAKQIVRQKELELLQPPHQLQ
jgi:hypothetical protein